MNSLERRSIGSYIISRRIAIFGCILLCAPALYFFIGSTSGNSYPLSSDVFYSTRYSIDQMRNFAFKNSIATDFKPSYYTRWNYSFSKIIEDPKNKFDIEGNDVIVFLHIQKTAGTSFEKFLVKYLDIERPCVCSKGKKRCTCRRPNKPSEIWLFSRYSTGWACGLHADFTEMFVSGCVDTAMDKKEGTHRKRRYFHTTFLRDPISRFISEYRHVNRGATWIGSRHVCNGRPPTPDELPLCFDPNIGWDDVGLDEFLHCPFNLAFNRQTRMLADLTLINCYSRTGMDQETRERIMLESAKNNLKNFAFFGIKEKMEDSQLLFQELFGLNFNHELSNWTKSKSNGTVITEKQMELIREKNKLDIELYDFAVKLFNKRLKLMKSELRQESDLAQSKHLELNTIPHRKWKQREAKVKPEELEDDPVPENGTSYEVDEWDKDESLES